MVMVCSIYRGSKYIQTDSKREHPGEKPGKYTRLYPGFPFTHFDGVGRGMSLEVEPLFSWGLNIENIEN